jgi:hypothetical protein
VTLPKSTITEDITDQVDGLTDTFTVSTGPFILGTLEVEHNGVRGRSVDDGGDDFEELSSSSFQTYEVPKVGDTLKVQFEIEDSGAGFPLVVASGRND